MTHRMKKHLHHRAERSGLILLIALGMLALFSLLAVTYVVTAGASKNASNAIAVRARNSNSTIEGSTQAVVNSLIRGTSDQTSPFYGQNLLGDIYSPNPIRTRFGHRLQGSLAFQPDWCRRIASSPTSPLVNLVKLSLSTNNVVNGPLSGLENEYNSRILTILEGPLAGQSFRILKYVGNVRGPTSGGQDANIADSNSLYSANRQAMAWASSNYSDANAANIEYSVLIDLSEVQGTRFTGQFYNSVGKLETVSLTLNEWLTQSGLGVQSLFYLVNGTNYAGYSLIINDAAFNNAGIGVGDVATNPGFGSLDSRELLRIPSSREKIPPALLPSYDYLQNLQLMNVGVAGIGSETRTSLGQVMLNGASNEGIDVADWRDPWLANQSYVSGQLNIIPSFHRPEIVNYIAALFGDPASMSAPDVAELLRLIDASTARILSYSFNGVSANPGFRQDDPLYPRLPVGFNWSSPTPTAAEILSLQTFVSQQINGTAINGVNQWDVDNDRDGIADSVLVPAGLPPVYSPDGRMLKAVAAILVEDLDSRINLNTAGDRSQGLAGFGVQAFDAAFKTKTTSVGTHPLSQGSGYGPADISLTSLFSGNPLLLRTSASTFSFFDDRYGARRYARRPINFTDSDLDRVPGKRVAGTWPANDVASQVNEREAHFPFIHGRGGAPFNRRSNVATEIDRHGNLAFVQPLALDANPYNPNVVSPLSEIDDDAYESSVTGLPNSDDPFGLAELEAILLRYEGDSSALPQRLKERLLQVPNYGTQHAINKLITTRSAELRYPNLASAARTTAYYAPGGAPVPAIEKPAGSFLQWIKMLHAQRYQDRNRTYPKPAAAGADSDDPELTYKAIEELFPMDFTKGLRMDLNRPFGNGYDDDGDGQIDEPNEIYKSAAATTDRMGGPAAVLNGPPTLITTTGAFSREIQEKMGASSSGTRTMLGPRQIYARNLYCLAQLIIPRNYVFPGMTTDGALTWANAKIRAAAIAQWAVNIVDFRDSDAAMTRFEYDIVPFGCGSNFSGPTARPAYWAPDHLDETVNGTANKFYVDVVWGMEMPELLLTESLATHDIRIRDTDLEGGASSNLYDPTNPMKDQDMDQYRFPLASLFLELYCPRTTDTVNSNDASAQLPGDMLLPGAASLAPTSLYTYDAQNRVSLNLGKMAPSNTAWGSQPVWRIAISEFDTTNNPNVLRKAKKLDNITHQKSTPAAIGGTAWAAPASGIASPDAVVGNGLHYDLSASTTANPVVFDRFVWFANVAPAAGQSIPDVKPSLDTPVIRPHLVYYNRFNATPLLQGGSYMVIGPRLETEFGSSTCNPVDDTKFWDPVLRRQAMVDDATKKPIRSPSFQKISLSGSTSSTKMMNDVEANAPWMTRVKTPLTMVCATKEPNDPALPAGSDWDVCFPSGVGLNISFPAPNFGNSIWKAANRPSVKLNSLDTRGAPAFGYGHASTPPDSWIDVGPSAITGLGLPDVPFDIRQDPNGPPIANSEIAKLGKDDPQGTWEDIRAAYLQRLADPELAYDPISNPYITVDWISLDLHVFNGEAPFSTAAPPPPAVPPTPPTYKFQSRYKDGSYVAGTYNNPAYSSADGSTTGFSYHSPVTPDLVDSVAQSDPPTPKHRSYFKYQLGYRTAINWSGDLANCGTTLGYLNAGFLKAPPGAALTPPLMSETTGAYAIRFDGFGPPVSQFLNASNNLQNVLSTYLGSPKNLASLAWLNRPFASPYELMLVPSTGPGQFGFYHSAFSGKHRKPFSYLPSFQTSNPSHTEEPLPVAQDRSYWLKSSEPKSDELDMMLLMELVETQPPFADANKVPAMDIISNLMLMDDLTKRFLNSYVPPGYYYPTGFSPPAGYFAQDATRGPAFVAPFNKFPNFVTAGKVNLNTITEDKDGFYAALKAIENNFLADGQRANPLDPVHQQFQAQFAKNRRGYTPAQSPFFAGNPGLNHPNLNGAYPTQFAGAYRPASSANIAPYVPDPEARARLRGKYSFESTLFQSNDKSYAASPPVPLADQPMLFSTPEVAGTGTDLVNQHAFKRMERVMRLPNLVTNQSNVFAVWVTVSLYEYDPVTGYGNEYVDEIGQPKRERAFYIIDRSVPVGYKPGENLNAERTILLKRKLN